MDVHFFLRIKDACLHYLSIVWAAILQGAATFCHGLQKIIPKFGLQSLATLIKINLFNPLAIVINCEFSPGLWLVPLQKHTANALEILSNSSHHLRNRVLAAAWPSLSDVRDTASKQVELMVTGVRVTLDKLTGRVLPFGRLCFQLLRKLSPTKVIAHLVHFATTVFLEAGLVKTSVVNKSKSRLKRQNVTSIRKPLDAGLFLKNATNARLSSYTKVRDVLSHLSWTSGIQDAVSCSFGHALRIATACVPPLVSFIRGLLDAVAALIDSTETYLTSLLTFCQSWLLNCVKTILSRGFPPLTRQPLHSALLILVTLLVLRFVTRIPWSCLTRKVHMKLWLHSPRTSRRQCRVGLKSFALSTIRHLLSLIQTFAKIAGVVFSALKYFVLTPVDTLILLVFVTAYIFMSSCRVIGRFSLLDQMRLDMALRNNMPGAWVSDMDEEARKGLFRSTLQLQTVRHPTTFSSLPRALRSRIYELALTDHRGFKWDNRMKTLRSNLSPSLLRVSHDTRQSTLPIPFNMNAIVIDTSSTDLQPYVPPELRRHLLPQDQPCGREQLLDLLSSLRIPQGSSLPTSPTHAASSTSHSYSSANTDDTETDAVSPPPRQPLLHIGALLRAGTTPWVVEIREPYTRVWSFDVAAIVAHLPVAPSLVINYTITIPPGPPRPLSKAQHLARQLAAAVHQGSTDRRFRVYVDGLQHWEELVRNSILGAGEFDDVHGFLVEGPTDLRREVARVQRAVERMNAHNGWEGL